MVEDLASPLAVDLPEGDRARDLHGEPLLGSQLLLLGREPDVDGVVALGVDDDQVLGAIAVEVDGPDQPGIAGRMGRALGLAERSPGPSDRRRPALSRPARPGRPGRPGPSRRPPGAARSVAFAGIDLLGIAELSLALVEQDLDLGRRAVEHQVGLAVAVEVAGIHADDFLVDRNAHQPHPAVVLEVVGVLAERAVRLVVVGFLGAQQQVDPRPAVVADDDVVDLVAVQVLEQEVADPVIELVELQRQEPEIIGELRLRILLRSLRGSLRPRQHAYQKEEDA